MFDSLFAKLAIVLFLLFGITGAGFVVASFYSAHLYQQEISQRLNHNLAGHIVDEYLLLENGIINNQNLENLFHELMVINPALELYLLDTAGTILAYSAAPKKILRKTISLNPIKDFIGDDANFPLLGDDPRSDDRKKAFSVAPIMEGETNQGYIYAILGGEQVDELANMWLQSNILQWGTLILVSGLLFALLFALLIFAFLTRRLKVLSTSMDDFRQSDFSQPVQLISSNNNHPDEIDQLITTFTAMTDRMQSQLARLKETDHLRRELIANVSHDLRTPLSSLKGYIETLIMKSDSLPEEERQQYLNIAYRHADILNRRIDDLFELAKLEAKELKPKIEPFSVSELIHDVSQKFILKGKEKNIDIEIDTGQKNAFAKADIGLIERVLENLIENAIRNTPEGGTVKVATNQIATNQINISVTDTGYGIPEDEIPHIFDRFYRKTSGRNSKDNGAGLGLTIAQRIISLHGSHLSVSSKPDRGTCFNFQLHEYAYP
ncbi:MAG: ATP-binding protein [Gammaproteobacteria bacterium]